MRLIDADALNTIKFHPLPYTHIVPADLPKCQTEAYERGWNDAIDVIIENAETIEERKTGRWVFPYADKRYKKCSACGAEYYSIPASSFYCPNCGAKMEVEDEDR